MTKTDIVAQLRPHPHVADDASVMYQAGDIRQVFAHITRLEERCAAYKGQVEDGAAEVERLKKNLRTVQNAAKTIASCQGTELEHLRQNYAFDHKLRAEVESLREVNSLLTDQTEASEARADALQAEVERLRAVVEPFAAVAERDIGETESDADLFRPMSARNARAPLITVGDLRRARAALQHQEPKP